MTVRSSPSQRLRVPWPHLPLVHRPGPRRTNQGVDGTDRKLRWPCYELRGLGGIGTWRRNESIWIKGKNSSFLPSRKRHRCFGYVDVYPSVNIGTMGFGSRGDGYSWLRESRRKEPERRSETVMSRRLVTREGWEEKYCLRRFSSNLFLRKWTLILRLGGTYFSNTVYDLTSFYSTLPSTRVPLFTPTVVTGYHVSRLTSCFVYST